MNLIDDLNWRYATKAYTDDIVPEEKVDFILEAINLAATSCGLQPYRVLVVHDKELQAKLAEGSFNTQIATASHLMVFAAYNTVTTKHIQSMVDLMAETRNTTTESMADFFGMLDSYFKTQSNEEQKLWAERQTYIALGTALIAAASLRVDSTPMEGFDRAHFDRLLGLEEKGLHSIVILSLGYRDSQNDYLANLPKVRIGAGQLGVKTYGS